MVETKVHAPHHCDVLPSNRDFMNFCQMTYSMGCSRWLMLRMVQTMYLNLRLKPDVYAAC